MSIRENPSPQSVTPAAEPAEGSSAFTRLGWMLFGPLFIFLSVLGISKQPHWELGMRDLVFALLLLATLWVRYIDVVRFRGTTANGELATLADVRRYALTLIALSGGLWTLAHFVDL